MSRIGRKPIQVPANVKVSITGGVVTVQGPLGSLPTRVGRGVAVTWDQAEKSIAVSIADKDAQDRQVRSAWGTTRALIQNTIKGVTAGYEKNLEVVGVGWTAAVTGSRLKLVVGYANPLELAIPGGLTVTVEKSFVKVRGADKQSVGQFAAEVRASRKPEPYNGKGIKYVEEVIKRKQGKTFGA